MPTKNDNVPTSQAEQRESRIVQTALHQLNQFLRTVLDALTAHIAIVDQTGTIIAINAAWQRVAAEHSRAHEASVESGPGAAFILTFPLPQDEAREEMMAARPHSSL